MKVVVIDYGSGNLRSVVRALELAARDIRKINKILLTSNSGDLPDADYVVLPGVGSFGDCLAGLKSLAGMRENLNEFAIDRCRPFLGICVGMHLMGSRGVEYGEHVGLGWIKGEVTGLIPQDKELKIPHMGWNELILDDKSHPFFLNVGNSAHVYFVHSYSMKCERKKNVLARVEHGEDIAAVVGFENMIGTQFHPEKSQRVGLAMLKNFLSWRP